MISSDERRDPAPRALVRLLLLWRRDHGVAASAWRLGSIGADDQPDDEERAGVPWQRGVYAWTRANPGRIEPVPARGRLGLVMRRGLHTPL